MKPMFGARYEPDPLYTGLGRPRPRHKTELGGLAWPGPFNACSLFCTYLCLSTRFPCLLGQTGPFRPATGQACASKRASGPGRLSQFPNRADRVAARLYRSTPSKYLLSLHDFYLKRDNCAGAPISGCKCRFTPVF
jgi:hypothetical protein